MLFCLETLLQYEQGEFKIPEDAEPGVIYDGCNCGAWHFTILPTGDVYACRRVADSKVGNVFNDGISKLWYGEMEKYRDYTKFRKCSKCELLPWCRGCPAVAKGTYGSFYDADPPCWKKRNDITGEALPGSGSEDIVS
ncbi:SPASM domain-containing protein [Methanomassiliicoccales archaeon LGM-DZ1]|nr:SPASM domain-containing protein [Methanomassiliicoccales archaeon LGM-DZ1]